MNIGTFASIITVLPTLDRDYLEFFGMFSYRKLVQESFDHTEAFLPCSSKMCDFLMDPIIDGLLNTSL